MSSGWSYSHICNWHRRLAGTVHTGWSAGSQNCYSSAAPVQVLMPGLALQIHYTLTLSWHFPDLSPVSLVGFHLSSTDVISPPDHVHVLEVKNKMGGKWRLWRVPGALCCSLLTSSPSLCSSTLTTHNLRSLRCCNLRVALQSLTHQQRSLVLPSKSTGDKCPLQLSFCQVPSSMILLLESRRASLGVSCGVATSIRMCKSQGLLANAAPQDLLPAGSARCTQVLHPGSTISSM